MLKREIVAFERKLRSTHQAFYVRHRSMIGICNVLRVEPIFLSYLSYFPTFTYKHRYINTFVVGKMVGSW